jgi:hypothetical protein
VKFIALAEILDHVLRPLVCFGQQENLRVTLLNEPPQFFQELMSLGEVFAVGPFSFEKVRNCIHTKAVDSDIEPKGNDFEDGVLNFGIFVVQIGLMAEEAMPVKGAGGFIPSPV